MALLIVCIGGAFGSLTRYQLGKILSEKCNTAFPIGTYIINMSGAFLLGVVSSAGVSSNVYLLLADGFLGAYTTFSTFMYEGFNLFLENERLNAAVYIISSLVLGIISYFTGFSLSNLLY